MKAVGIILAGGRSQKLGSLTNARATCAMPIGSCYRAIDFTLSNMSNSGMNKVAVITQFNSRSLHDHLSSSKWWDFGRKMGGLFVFSPYGADQNAYWFRGTADSIFQNLSFLRKSNEPYVIIASGDGIYKMDYNEILEYHIEKGAEVTIMCKDMGDKDVREYGVIELNSKLRLLEFEEKPVEPQSRIVSLGVYVISRTLLIKLLETAQNEGRHDFVSDILIRYRKKLKIYGYMYNEYWSPINSVETYYSTNMDFLDKDIRKRFLAEQPYINTKPKDEPPAKYNAGAEAKNCVIGSGSIINGKIQDSILFRRVFTGENSTIKNSILMEGCYIGNNCVVENAILDKEVILSDGKQIIGKENEPVILGKNSVI